MAGKLRIPFTTGLLLGIGETFKERIEDLFLIRDLNQKYNHIQEIIMQNFVYKDGISFIAYNSITIKEILKFTWTAKIIFQT